MLGLNSPRKLDREKWCSSSLLDNEGAQSYKAPDLDSCNYCGFNADNTAIFSFIYWKKK